MEEGYVGYIGKLEGILTNQSYGRDTGDRASTKPMGKWQFQKRLFSGSTAGGVRMAGWMEVINLICVHT